MIDIRILNACIITMDADRRIISNGGIAISNGIIIDVGDSDYIQTHYHAKRTLQMNHHIVMPGFVDTHAHAGHTLLTTTVKDTIFWMDVHNRVYNNYLSEAYWNIEAKLAGLQRLRAGITTGISVMGSESMCYRKDYVEAYTSSYASIGLRNILCCGPGNEPWPKDLCEWNEGVSNAYRVEYDDAIKTLEDIVCEYNNANNGLTKIFLTPYKIISSLTSETESELCLELTEFDKKNAYEIRRIAKKYNTRIHTDAFKGMVKLASQDENALLGEDVHLQHCQGLSFDEVKILAETKTSVSFWPTIGHFKSRAPIIEMMGLGMKVSISTDAASYTSGHDLFTNMRRAQLFVRALYNDRSYLPNEKVLEMVTIDAAHVVGMQNEVGSIEIGKKADIIAIDTKKPKFYPITDPVNLVVRVANINDVDCVFCDGAIIMENGETILDEECILRDAQEFADNIVRVAGLSGFDGSTQQQWGNIKAYYSERRIK